VAAISNRTIVQELKSGDRLGCARLVDMYQARLIDEAVHVFHLPSEDAEELVSDVLLAVVRKINTFEFKRGDGDFHLWVITIFRNKVRDVVRHRALTDGLIERFEEGGLRDDNAYSKVEREVTDAIIRQYQEAIRDSESAITEGESAESAGAEGAGNSTVAAKLLAIADALERLETWERVLLRCRALDVPYDDIARYTDKSVAQLKVYHARVKKKFVKILAEHYPELQGNEERTG